MSGSLPRAEELKFPVNLEDLDEESAKLYDYVKFKRDPASGEMHTRDLQAGVDAVEALEVLRTVRQAAEFHKDPPSRANLIARKLYESLSELLKQQLPDVAVLLEKETALIIARDAAQRMQEKYEAELSKVKPLAYLARDCGSDLLGFDSGRGPCDVGGRRGGHSLRVLAERPVHDLAGGVLLLAGGRAR